MPYGQPYQENWETVAVSLTKGLELRSRFRIIEPTALTKAQNVEFPVAGGPQKRRGHTATTLATGKATASAQPSVANVDLTPYTLKTVPAGWLGGYGEYFGTSADPDLVSSAATPCLGVGGWVNPATDNPVVWTGTQVIEYGPFDATSGALPPVVMPYARVEQGGPTSVLLHSFTNKDGLTVSVVGSTISTSTLYAPALETLTMTVTTGSGLLLTTRNLGNNNTYGDVRVLPLGDGAIGVIWCGSAIIGRVVNRNGSVGPTTVITTLPVLSVGQHRLDACPAANATYKNYLAYWVEGGDNFRVNLTGLVKDGSGSSAYLTQDGSLLVEMNTVKITLPGPISISCHPTFGQLAVACVVDGTITGLGTGVPTYKPQYLCVAEARADLTSFRSAWNNVRMIPCGTGVPDYYNDAYRVDSLTEHWVDLPYQGTSGAEGWVAPVYGVLNFPKAVAYSKVAVAYRALVDRTLPGGIPVGFQNSAFDVWASCLADKYRANPEDSSGSFAGTYGYYEPVGALDPAGPCPLLTKCLFKGSGLDYDPVEGRYVGYEVATRAVTVGQFPNVVLQHQGKYGGPFYAHQGSRCGRSFSAQPTAILVDHQMQPIGKYSSLASRTSYHSRYLQIEGNYLVSYALPRVTRGIQLYDDTYPYLGDMSSLTLSTIKQAEELSVIDFILEDYLRPLSVATAGKSTVIAGSQVWRHSTNELYEDGFHTAPEFMIKGMVTHPSAASVLVTVDAVFTTSTGEEIRSPNVFRGYRGRSIGALGDMRVYMPLTRKSNVKFEVFATTPGGSTLYKFTVGYKNVTTSVGAANGFQFRITDLIVDIGWDSYNDDVIRQQVHPASQLGFLQRNSPPACENVRDGKTRTWYFGGQVPLGSVTASLLYQPGYIGGWNDANTQVVGGANLAVTDMAFIQDNAYIFTRVEAFSIIGEGPDNFGGGPAWITPRHLAYEGVVAANTTVPSRSGILFLSTSGLKLLGYSGDISEVSNADPAFLSVNGIGSLATEVVSGIHYPEKAQARWYKRTGDAVVMDTMEGRFATWTGVNCVAALSTPQGVTLVKQNGQIWREHYGDPVIPYNDAGTPIEMVIRTAWLSPATMGGFARVRRVGWFGEYRGDHQVRMRTFYNEKDVHEDEYVLDWSLQAGVAVSTWGSGTWGFGVWGGATTGLSRLWRWARRLARQKCSVVMFELSDMGAASAAFAPVCLGLELGKRGGIDRVRSV